MDGWNVELFGAHEHRIDAKGRVALPAQFRDRFKPEQTCIIAPEANQRCLVVFTPHDFTEVVEGFKEKKRQGRFTQRQFTGFMGSVSQSTIDSQGRILLSDHLREYASLDKDAFIIGTGNHISIFAAEQYNPEVSLANVPDLSELL